MNRAFLAAAALVCIGCAGYLLLDPMERARFFLTRQLGKWLFPQLDPYQRQKKFTILAGTILATFVTAGTIVFIIKRMGDH